MINQKYSSISYIPQEKPLNKVTCKMLHTLLLCIVFLFHALFFVLLHTPIQAQADSAQTVANLVIFVKYPGYEDLDVFNAEYRVDYPDGSQLVYGNWQEIKQMYEEGNGYAYNDSFQNYISVITEGKVSVANVFPQEYEDNTKKGGKAVLTYTLNQPSYSSDAELISEVIAYCDSLAALDSSAVKLDNLNSGIIDNLTIVLQDSDADGDELPGGKPPHKAQYGGSDTINGLKVFNYNMIPSSSLVTDDASIGFASAQGVIAHEFLHTLGLPDLYRTSGIGDPVGPWDVMASNSCFLQYPLSYLRAERGWISSQTITTAGTYTLTAVDENGGNKVFVIKTPLSDSEYIVVEYRKKAERIDGSFEYQLPESGLIIYRVDTTVEYLTNVEGNNYIYVYRQGVTHPENAMDTNGGMNLVYSAALGAGETYGSTDLNADFSQNTLYYSDGTNSGVRISNITLSADETQLTFTLEMADYANADVWEKTGDSLHTNVDDDPILCADETTNTVYAAYVTSGQVQVKAFNGTFWTQVGSTLANAESPTLAMCGGELYLAYTNTSTGGVVCCKLTNGAWSNLCTYSATNPMNLQLIVDSNNIYVAYQEDVSSSVKKLVIRDIKKNTLITDSKQAGYFSNPVIVKVGSGFYVLYSDFFSTSPTKIEMYDTSKSTWTTVHEYSLTQTNCHILKEKNGKLYAFVGGYDMTPVVSIYDGAQWVDTNVFQMSSYLMVTMEIISDEIYITYLDTGTDQTTMLYKTGNTFSVRYGSLGTNHISMDTACIGSTMYLVTKSINTTEAVVRSKKVTLPSYSLTLTPPIGYSAANIYVDGIAHTATENNGSFTTILHQGNARTATMYFYNTSGVPTGMYVWRLSFSGGNYTATPLTDLQDLLSYHGFSIRVTSPSGIRFKSGIGESTKAALLSSGVDGYYLSEYGTLFITSANRNIYPFVKLGRKTGGGRSYWTENGVINDKVFETVSGRVRFASVLTNLPASQYATEFAFRGYVILGNNSERIILYGPPVSRSIYTVAKQIMNRGEFTEGTANYNYIQSIIESVEE